RALVRAAARHSHPARLLSRRSVPLLCGHASAVTAPHEPAYQPSRHQHRRCGPAAEPWRGARSHAPAQIVSDERPRSSISNDGSERRIAPNALDKFKTQVRAMTRRTRGISLPQLIEDLTPYLIGWRGYFGFCQTPRVLTNLEAWIRRRLRSYLWRQWQNGHNRFNELRRRGVPKFNAAVAAGSPTGFWRMSRHPAVQQALRNHYFDSLGLSPLHVSVQA